MIGRRAVVSALAAGACAGALPAPGASASGAGRRSGTAGRVRRSGWEELAERLGGRLLLPGDSRFAGARLGFNRLNDGAVPAAVALCTSAADVQACVAAARERGVRPAARGGGHSYAGYSTPAGGLVVDLRALSGVRVLPDGTVHVGAGARLAEVYARLAAAGRALPAGTCPTVGIAGLALGGGIGLLTRRDGLTCDRLLGAAVVTADSRLLPVSAQSASDLYWALRGGGGGGAGIVTGFVFRSAEAPPELTLFQADFPEGSTSQAVGAWQEWIPGLPRELWSGCILTGGRPPRIRVRGCFTGPAEGVRPHLARLAAAAGAPGTSWTLATRGYLDTMRAGAHCEALTEQQCRPQNEGGVLTRGSFVAASRILPRALDAGRLTAALDGRTGVALLLDDLGGAVGDLAPADTAFPHRTALACAQVYATATGTTRPAVTAAVHEVRDALAALGASGAYVNYIDPALPDWGRAYWGDNLPRLRETVRRHDPDGVFDFAQSPARA